MSLLDFSYGGGGAAVRLRMERENRLHSSHVTSVQCEHEGGAYLLCASVSLLINSLSRTHLAGESCRDSEPMSSCLVDT